ncbi:MAG: hypothetical protein IPL41_14695 [Micropruina sp.]|nr:hypothetical protein [Micropruina sp.]
MVPAPPSPANPGPAGPGRRTVLWLGAVVGVGAVGLSLLAGVNSFEQNESGEASTWADPDPDAGQGGQEYYLGGLTVLAPTGWTQVSATEHRLVLQGGANTVTFLHYEADQDANAMDEARQQLRRYAADVRTTTEVSATDDTSDYPETAEVTLTGKVDGQAVDVVSSVVLTTDTYEAAAVVSVVLQGAGSDIAREVASMRDDFLSQLG